ncbi:ADP-ribosylglycohydrolase family protein [bacterium]|nr:ADP-ribosylglycohydrolase family protein [bacterium]
MQMKRLIHVPLCGLVLCMCGGEKQTVRTISLEEFTDRMKAGWIGQMAGVGWGAPTEFRAQNRMLSKEEVPFWDTAMINQFNQDDIYVEMTFLRSLEKFGPDVSIRQAGIDFANSGYQLWHANKAGRDNLRSGIAPPWSGHPKYNSHADDIDYQIEADFAGLISPGMPQEVIRLGETFGRLMNYGDGLYGGLFVGGMYAEAFFEKDIEKIIQAGLDCIPPESQYAECIRDVTRWFRENPDNWQSTWERINEKYQNNPAYRRFSCEGATDFNIDAKINGAYIVMGLLYGKEDPDSTIVISMRCGQDSDCNPSSAAGILFTALGLSGLPSRFTEALDTNTRFSFTEYNFPDLVSVCGLLARDAVVRLGGTVEKDPGGGEIFRIPARKPEKPALETCWDPGVYPDDENYSEEEMNLIVIRSRKPEEFISQWQVSRPYRREGADVSGLFQYAFAPETGGAAEWKKMPMGEQGYSAHVLELGKLFRAENCAAYVRTKIWSEKACKAVLEIGSDDGVKVWFNGRQVHANNVLRAMTPGEDKADVDLKKGWNICMMKITQGSGGWEAAACLTSPDGKSLEGLRYDAESGW